MSHKRVSSTILYINRQSIKVIESILYLNGQSIKVHHHIFKCKSHANKNFIYQYQIHQGNFNH